jgi:hypothetical protein
MTILEHFKNKSEFIFIERYVCAYKLEECISLVASTKTKNPMIIGYKRSKEYPDFIYAVKGKSYKLKIPYGPFFLILSKIKDEIFFTDSYALTMLVLNINTYKTELISAIGNERVEEDFFLWLNKKTDKAINSLEKCDIIDLI